MSRIALLARGALLLIYTVFDGSPAVSQTVEPACLAELLVKVECVESASRHLSPERQALLHGAAELIAGKLTVGRPVGLNFICTHNSRRSHLAQVWAAVAVHHYAVDNVQCTSGGTEATACNERVVCALRRAGFSVVAELPDAKNPVYLLQFAEKIPPLQLFSKRYDESESPSSGFVAMMCCSEADVSCPVVLGAVGRVALHYRDPKESDGTPLESETYDARSDQIAAEMFFLLREVRMLLAPTPD